MNTLATYDSTFISGTCRKYNSVRINDEELENLKILFLGTTWISNAPNEIEVYISDITEYKDNNCNGSTKKRIVFIFDSIDGKKL